MEHVGGRTILLLPHPSILISFYPYPTPSLHPSIPPIHLPIPIPIPIPIPVPIPIYPILHIAHVTHVMSITHLVQLSALVFSKKPALMSWVLLQSVRLRRLRGVICHVICVYVIDTRYKIKHKRKTRYTLSKKTHSVCHVCKKG
jgi:hypothetical protein